MYLLESESSGMNFSICSVVVGDCCSWGRGKRGTMSRGHAALQVRVVLYGSTTVLS